MYDFSGIYFILEIIGLKGLKRLGMFLFMNYCIYFYVWMYAYGQDIVRVNLNVHTCI